MEVEVQPIDMYLNPFKRNKPVKNKKKYECISYIFLSSAIKMIEDKIKSSDHNMIVNEKDDDTLDSENFNDNFEDDNDYGFSDDDDDNNDDYYYDPYYDLGDEIEFNLTYNFKMKFNRLRINTKCIRYKKYNRTRKCKRNMIKAQKIKKFERYKENVLNNIEQPKPIIQPQNNYNNVYNRYNSYYNEEEAIRRAINESRSNLRTSSGLTYQQILDLQTRELTPEDYELLLLLDESVPKKTLKENQISSFDTFVLKALCDINDELCTICMDMFQIGEELKKLKCNHIFHSTCINNWLSSYSTNCPVDGLSLA